MNKLKHTGFILLTIVLAISCSNIPDRPWQDAIPEKAPFVIIPEESATLNSVLDSPYAPFLDDITSSAVQLLSRVDSTAQSPVTLSAIMLYPGVNDQLETVWVAQAPTEFLSQLTSRFDKDFEQNKYQFNDIEVHILYLGDRRLYTAQLNDDLLLSESSLGLEDALRAYIGKQPRADLSDISPEPGHIIMNTPSLDGWAQQLALVTHRPIIKNAFNGTSPSLLSVNYDDKEQDNEVELSGNIPLSDDISSDLIAAISSENTAISLDRYIPSNAAASGLFRLPPRKVPPSSLPDTTQLDSVILEDRLPYTDIAETLSSEFSLVMFAKSGFLTTGEHLFLRKVSDPNALREALQELEDDDYIERSDDTYAVQSTALGKLIGSSFSTLQSFYLDVVGDVVAISKRKGLVEAVASDRDRRRTLYYEQSFREIKEDLPDEVGSFFIVNSDFYSFMEPFLSPNNYLDALTSKFDLLTMATTSNDRESVDFSLKTYQTEDRSAPYREKWLFPTGSDLTGEPILANIGGSDREEIIFTTESGNVFALAADGTVVMETNTGDDTPIGSPVAYDWYSTNQNVILQAAGNKIYGWDDNGESLPRFPFELDEPVTSPLIVEDIDSNGLPNAMVATADRKLHLLEGRGENASGWPVSTNAEITTKPTVDTFEDETTIFAFSENALHGWNIEGSERDEFPKFINASFNGSPVLYSGNILGNAADGYLYSMGPNTLFEDTLNVFDTSTESSDIEAVYASNNELVGTPSTHNLTVEDEDEEETYDETMFLTMSSNGSIFLINSEGQLRFTQNMGQPAAATFSPFVTDIDQDGNEDIIALADFGRLYVWEIADGQRLFTVPTSGMKHPIVTDIDGDGYNELIAQTSEGVRTWTIFGEDDQDEDDEENGDEEDDENSDEESSD